jgi:hypothetical protein
MESWVGLEAGLDGCGKSRPRVIFLWGGTGGFSCRLCFIHTCFFVFIVLHFAFLSLLATHNTNIHAPGVIFFVLCTSSALASLSWLSCILPFVFFTYNT